MTDEIDPKDGDSSEHKESSIEIIPNSKIGKYEVANLPVTATPMSGPSKPSQAMAFGSICSVLEVALVHPELVRLLEQ